MPVLTVDGAVVLTLLSVSALVAYLQRVAHRQYVGHILEAIAEETLECHQQFLEAARRVRTQPAPDVATLGVPFVVAAQQSGWVQQVSGAGLLAAVAPGSVLRLETRVGAFVVCGAPLAALWPAPVHPQQVQRALQRAVALGPVRTMQEDLDFGMRQLVDVALRALSPAVNDPTTAVEAVLRMTTILRPLLLGDLPPQVRRAPNGTVLLRPWDLDHVEYVRHAFEELRGVAAPSARVSTVLVRSLRFLLEAVQGLPRPELQRPGLQEELQRQLALVLRSCERAGLLPEELEGVRRAAHSAQDPRHAAAEADAVSAAPH